MLKDKIAILTINYADYKKGHLFKIVDINPYGIVSLSSEYILVAVDLKTGEPCRIPLIPYSNCDIIKNSEIIRTLYDV